MVPIHAALGLLLIALAGTSLSAAAVTESEAARHEREFSALQKSTRTFQATLRQTLSLQGATRPIVSTGTLFFETPNRMLLRFAQPAGEWVLINGTQFAIQKQGRPVQIKDTSLPETNRSQAASLLDFFSRGAERWHQDFDVTMTREGDLLLVHLKPWQTPTSTAQGVDSIVTTLQLPGYEVREIAVAMQGNNRISYQFSNIRRNAPLAANLFTIPSTP